MGLFGNKKKLAQTPTNGFRVFISNDPQYFWAAEYIDECGNIDEAMAFEDMQTESDMLHIGQFTMPKFKTLVANLFAEYLEVEKKVSNEDLLLLNLIERMPLNITIRRVKPKASGNNWSVQYLKGTVYYGKTLLEALKKLQDRQPKVAAKFAGPEA